MTNLLPLPGVKIIPSTFKFTGKYVPIVPTLEQQSVIDYLQANITNIIKAKPILGSTKWGFYSIAFYPSNKILVSLSQDLKEHIYDCKKICPR